MEVTESIHSWLVLLAATYSHFLEGSIVKGLGVLLPDIREQLGSATWIIGLCIGMIESWGYILGLSAPFMEKKFGARMCLMISGLTATIGVLVCSRAKDIYELFVGMALIGVLMSQFNVAMGILPQYFNKYYSVAVNICTLGSSFAVLVTPPFVQILEYLYGWRGALLILAGVVFQSAAFGALVVKKPDNNNDEKTKLIQHTYKENNRSFLKQLDVSLLFNPAMISCMIIPSIVEGVTLAGWLVHIVSFVVSTGASLRQASIVSTCGGIGLIVIRILLPFLDQIMSYRKIFHISSFIMAISLLLTVWFHTVPALCMTSMTFCIGKAMLASETYIAIEDISNRDQFGSVISWFHLFYGFAAMFGAVITGLLYDISGSYAFSFILLSAVSMLVPLALAVEYVWTISKH